MIQNEFFRSRTVEELPAALDRYGQFVGVFRAVGRRIGYGVEPDQDRRVRPDFRLVGRQQVGPVSEVVAQPDVAVFAVTVGRALLFGRGRFPAFVFLFGGPAGDRRFSAGFQRVGRAVFQPVEIAFDAGRESLYDRNEIVQVFDLGVQRDAAFSFLIGAGMRGRLAEQAGDARQVVVFDLHQFEPGGGRRFPVVFVLFELHGRGEGYVRPDVDCIAAVLRRTVDGKMEDVGFPVEFRSVRPFDVFPAGVVLVIVAGGAQRDRGGQQQDRDRRCDAPFGDFPG